jgi:predicted amidohydrolase YtcJ
MLDLLIENARIFTMDAARPTAQRIGIWRDRIVGLDGDIDALPTRRRVDLGGATVLPGFVDAHCHLAWAGLAARSTDVSACRSIAGVQRVVAAAAQQVAPDGWLNVMGYDQRPLGRHLTSADLDAVSGGRKVVLEHGSGHACVVSSAVLDLIGDPRSDTGLFTEAAMSAVHALRRPYAVHELADALATAAQTCAAQGITLAAEAGIGGDLVGRSPIEGLAYQRCLEDGRLPVRVQLLVTRELIRPTVAHRDDAVEAAFALGLRTGFGSSRLSLGALKVWLDGGMMARTAALTEPYVGTGASGELRADLDEISAAVQHAHAAGWQVALHAIGDLAVDSALDLLEQAQQAHPRPGVRNRIEHCGLVRPDQLDRMAALQVVAVVQPTFLYVSGADYASVLGPQRAPWLYRGRSFLDHGITVAGSSDRPVTDGAPLRAIEFMVERRSKEGMVIGPDEAITIDEALAAYTLGGAHACGMSDQLGSLSAGKLADLMVLDRDPHDVSTAELADLQVLATMVGGEAVFGDRLSAS